MVRERTGLMGWGYQGQTIEQLVSDAQAWGISTVVDVRLNPISRKPGFSKRALAAALQANEIGYLHLPELGNPRDNRAGFAEPGTEDSKAAKERFRADVLDTSAAQSALDTIEQIAADGMAFVLCFEADERCCHRSVILDAIGQRRSLIEA